MPAFTNTQRIIQLLQQHPRLDDDELSRLGKVSPRQQVNQICRRLENQGVLRREMGPRGKIVNILVDADAASTPGLRPVRAEVAALPTVPQPRTIPSAIPSARAYRLDLRDTLVLIPCSGVKAEGGVRTSPSPTILDGLSQPLAQQLAEARAAMAARAHMDNSLLCPAWQRYDGSLYRAAHETLAQVMSGHDASRILIVSGGYGLALAAEPIAVYDAVFHRRNWPPGLLEAVALEFARHHRIRRVRAFASMTTEYGKFLRSVPWAEAGIDDALMFCPEPTTGAMVRSPRAQGEALAAFLEGRLDEHWQSSDGLALVVADLSR